MKILLWAPFGAGEHYWGPGQSAFNLYSQNRNENIQIFLAHGYINHSHYELFEDQYFISDLARNDKLSLLKFLFYAKKWIDKNAHKFDVAHVLTDHHPAFLPAFWLQKKGIPTFIKIAGSQGNLVENSFLVKATGFHRFMLSKKNSFEYLVISNRIKNELINIGINKKLIHFLPNGVNTERFRPIDFTSKINLRRKLLIEDKFTVLFTGGLSARKKPSIIVESFEYLKGDSGIQLIIIGPDRDGGIERGKIKSLIDKYQLKNVILLPYTKEINKYYQIADIFVLPSSNEGLSNSLLEAQSSGLPALVTKISGSEDLIVEGVNGLFVKQDKKNIYNGIKKYYNDRSLLNNNAKNSRDLIIEKYDSKKIMKKHMNIFSKTD